MNNINNAGTSIVNNSHNKFPSGNTQQSHNFIQSNKSTNPKNKNINTIEEVNIECIISIVNTALNEKSNKNIDKFLFSIKDLKYDSQKNYETIFSQKEKDFKKLLDDHISTTLNRHIRVPLAGITGDQDKADKIKNILMDSKTEENQYVIGSINSKIEQKFKKKMEEFKQRYEEERLEAQINQPELPKIPEPIKNSIPDAPQITDLIDQALKSHTGDVGDTTRIAKDINTIFNILGGGVKNIDQMKNDCIVKLTLLELSVINNLEGKNNFDYIEDSFYYTGNSYEEFVEYKNMEKEQFINITREDSLRIAKNIEAMITGIKETKDFEISTDLKDKIQTASDEFFGIKEENKSPVSTEERGTTMENIGENVRKFFEDLGKSFKDSWTQIKIDLGERWESLKKKALNFNQNNP